MTMPATYTWRKILSDLTTKGKHVEPRGRKTYELLAYTSCVDMNYPIVYSPARNLGFKFMAAEAAWILSGDNRVATISPYSKAISRFSDDGIRFFGAYGPRIIDQLSYVVNALVEDQDSRQAVLTIWRPNPLKTKDVPCTISAQFVIRDGAIHCFDTMRSSDIWLGWPYDVFNFSMLAHAVMIEYREKTGIELKIGNLYLTAGSQHIYEHNVEQALKVLDEKPLDEERASPIADPAFDKMQDMDDLSLYLWNIAIGATPIYQHFLNMQGLK